MSYFGHTYGTELEVILGMGDYLCHSLSRQEGFHSDRVSCETTNETKNEPHVVVGKSWAYWHDEKVGESV